MPNEFDFDPSLPDNAKEILDMYRRKVFVEMYYLRDEGSNGYKITNGVRAGKVRGGYGYTFEVEAELFLAEDSPITISVSQQQRVGGSIVSCEGFTIYIVLESNIGETVVQASLHAEPWKLLEALNERLAGMTSANKLALKLMIDGRRLRTDKPINLVDSGQDAAMAHAQRDPITVIWGPPGTGKTHTMAEIAIRCMSAGKTVLVVSHSNISVDGVVLKVSELMRARGQQERLRRGKVMRFGHTRDERLEDDSEVVSRNYAIGRDPKRAAELRDLRKELDLLNKSNRSNSDEAWRLRQQINAIRGSVTEDEKRLVEQANLVATTASRLYSNKIFENKSYDVVMFDEVSMAYVPQVLCASMFAKERLVLVGDFRQLAPIAQSEKAKQILSRDIFWYLGICGEDQKAHSHPWLVMLDEQRRMHPGISAFSNSAFYGGLLKDHESTLHGRDDITRSEPCRGSATTLVDMRGTICPSGKNEDNSRFNILNAIISFGMALAAERSGVDVGIITPYAAQAKLIRAMKKDFDFHGDKTDIACSTVHQFQGSERDVIILDTVESLPSKRPGILTSSRENGSADRLVNVAVTRARGKLITVANKDLWDMPAVSRNNPFLKLTSRLLSQGNVLSYRDSSLVAELHCLDFGPDIDLLTISKANKLFIEDLVSAKRKIVVSIPDGSLNVPYDTDFCKALKAADSRGVEVLVKCANWDELPEAIKAIAWKSEDAIFPIVLIDRRICWYGMPQSRGKIALANGGSVTTALQTPFRMTGRDTVGMIATLTDLERRVVDGQKTRLRQRHVSSTDNGRADSPDGLALYIKQNCKCKKCGGPVRLARGKSRKFFLSCTKCRETDLIDPGVVDRYITISGAKCPKCGADLYANVNRFGIHTRCDGDRKHYVNLDEI